MCISTVLIRSTVSSRSKTNTDAEHLTNSIRDKKYSKKNNQKKIIKKNTQKYSKKKIKEGDNNLLLGIPFTAVNSVGFLSPTLPSSQCLYRRQNCSHCLEVGSDQGHTPFQQWTSQRRQGIAGITPLRMLGFALLDSVLKLRVDRR